MPSRGALTTISRVSSRFVSSPSRRACPKSQGTSRAFSEQERLLCLPVRSMFKLGHQAQLLP
jgi:hypothetical protein